MLRLLAPGSRRLLSTFSPNRLSLSQSVRCGNRRPSALGGAVALTFVLGSPSLAMAIPSNARLSGEGIQLIDGIGGYCNYEFSWPGAYVVIDMRVYGPSSIGLIASETGDGFGSAEVQVDVELPITGTYTCEVEVFLDGDSAGTDEVYLDIYLLILDVTIGTFIPENNICGPFGCSERYTGDDRFPPDPFGSTRSWQRVSVIQPYAAGNLITDDVKDGGLSERYDEDTSIDGSGNLTAEARNDWAWGPPMKLEWADGDVSSLECTAWGSGTSLGLRCIGNAKNDLEAFAPGITYDFEFNFNFNSPESVTYGLLGPHDGFPDYEVFVGSQLLYHHHHGSYTVWNLFEPQEEFVLENGEIQ